jgi:hypothetical protein
MRRVLMTAAAITALSLPASCTSTRDAQAELADGDDPIATLTADVRSTRYGAAYWTQQSDSNTETWRKAKEYCARSGVTAHGQKVNCGAVAAAEHEETARHPDRRPAGALRP